MAKDEMAAGAEHVLAHGTARSRAMQDGREEESSGKGKVGKKRIKRMVIEPAHDGSHVIRHEHHTGPGQMVPRHEDETYTAPNTEALKQHIEEHLGGANPSEEAGEGAEEQAAEEEQAAGAGA